MNAHSFPVINLQRTGRNIEQLRRAAGLSVRQLQDYFGFEYPQAIYKWQHGECLPTVDNLLALSRLLGVPMDELLICEDQELPAFWGTTGFFSQQKRTSRPEPETSCMHVPPGDSRSVSVQAAPDGKQPAVHDGPGSGQICVQHGRPRHQRLNGSLRVPEPQEAVVAAQHPPTADFPLLLMHLRQHQHTGAPGAVRPGVRRLRSRAEPHMQPSAASDAFQPPEAPLARLQPQGA